MTAIPSYTRTLMAPIALPDGTSISAISMQQPTCEMLEALEDLGFGRPALDDNGKPITNEKGEPLAKTPTLRDLRNSIEILAGYPIDSLKKLQRTDFQDLVNHSGPLLGNTDGPDAESTGTSPVPSAAVISSSSEPATTVTS